MEKIIPPPPWENPGYVPDLELMERGVPVPGPLLCPSRFFYRCELFPGLSISPPLSMRSNLDSVIKNHNTYVNKC